MDLRGERGSVATGMVVGVAVLALVASVSFVLLTKRGGEEAASAASGALDAAAEAQDRRALSSLRNGLAAAKTAYTDTGSYAQVTPEVLGQIEPSLGFVAGPSGGPTQVSVGVTDGAIGLAARSESGTCVMMRDDVAASATTYGSGEPCTGENALATATSPTA
jgi:hypothetical protein